MGLFNQNDEEQIPSIRSLANTNTQNGEIPEKDTSSQKPQEESDGVATWGILRNYRKKVQENDTTPDSSRRATIAVIFVILILVIAFTFGRQFTMNRGITASTIQRTALPADGGFTVSCIDKDGWITNGSDLNTALSDFYTSTGVLPCLYIVSDEERQEIPYEGANSQEKLNAIAQKYFQDNSMGSNGFVFVFSYYKDTNTWLGAYYVGDKAASVMDTEALTIFTDYITKYINNSRITKSDMFSKVYTNTASRIMSVTATTNTRNILIFIGLVVLIVVGGGFYLWRLRKKEQWENEQKQSQT